MTLARDFEKTGETIDVVPQDVTRVFLNLFGNGFYAANKRRLGTKEAGFRPTIKVTTRDLGDRVEVKVRDNGTGMPPEVREKLFQPFFTTKPTGEGTGLGLSISYDIVTQQHGGTIEVDWPLRQALEIGDKATNGKTLTELYEQMRSTPVMTDLPDVWRQLGVQRLKGSVTFDDRAPLASIRAAICGS